MAKVLFIYGTTGGNTQMAVEMVAGLLSSKGHETVLQRAEASKPEDIKAFDVCVLASPTYGHGLLQEEMLGFIHLFKTIRLQGKPCAVIGLGDPQYDAQYHIESAAILEKAITDAGGKILLPALKISRTPVIHLKGLIPNWAEKLSQLL